jgi:hypothetical protein
MLGLILNGWELVQTAATRTVANLLKYDMTGTRTFCGRHLNGLQEPSPSILKAHLHRGRDYENVLRNTCIMGKISEWVPGKCAARVLYRNWFHEKRIMIIQ